jgi:hypothetical protein
MTVNEVRELENLNPIGPEGDQHFVPLNMTTLEDMSAEPEPPPPPPVAEEPAPEPPAQEPTDTPDEEETEDGT